VGVDVTEFMEKCGQMLSVNGMVIFETHRSKNAKKIIAAIEKAGYSVEKMALIENRRHVLKCIKNV